MWAIQIDQNGKRKPTLTAAAGVSVVMSNEELAQSEECRFCLFNLAVHCTAVLEDCLDKTRHMKMLFWALGV